MSLSELHLFILWDKVGPARSGILRHIAASLDILRVFRLHWNPDCFSDNLTRFYGQHLPPGSDKEKSCGIGPLTLVVVRDDSPHYAARQTTRGPSSVNTRIFDIKECFRSPAEGGLPLHATNTSRETDHDLALLLGVDSSQFTRVYPGPWNGEITCLKRDISGAYGWKSYRELFSVLNATVDYVVLRNFEELPDNHDLDAHGDIDLLVGNYVDAILVANAAPVFDDPHRVHHNVIISGQAIPFDFRYVGDDYYDPQWERNMLASRCLMDRGIYVPDAESHFFALLYHAAIHKHAISPEYHAKLVRLAADLDIATPGSAFFDAPDQLREFLRRFMSPRGYRFTRPSDPSVVFRGDIALGRFGYMVDKLLPMKRRLAAPSVPILRNQPTTTYLPLLRTLGLPGETVTIDITPDDTPLFGHTPVSGEEPRIVLGENPFGIKLFNGLASCSSNMPHMALYGIEPIALGRRQLERALAQEGLTVQRRYYPFPGHKQPKVVIAEAALQEDGFSVANLLALIASCDPTGGTHPVFHEQMVWRTVIANELLPDLANSFLIVAGKDESALAALDQSYLASAYTADRLPQFATETVFRKAADGRIVVEKKLLFPGKRNNGPTAFHHALLLHHVDTVAEYIPGELYVVELQRRLARGEGIDAVADWAADWLNTLRIAADTYVKTLPGNWLDAIPQNFIRAEDGALHRIDEEWEISGPIPMPWVVVRGMLYSFSACPTSPALNQRSLGETIRIVAASSGINIDAEEIDQAIKLETELRVIVTGVSREKTGRDLETTLAEAPPHAGINTPTSHEVFSSQLAALAQEIHRIKSTVSWRITKPLRAMWNIPRRWAARFFTTSS